MQSQILQAARWACLSFLVLLTACAEAAPSQGIASAASQPAKGTNKPYQVNGVWYHPKADPDYDETGMASWYGPGFHGKRTANGERFDQDALTAAHTTLPMATMVRVVNLANGREVIVRINDRGPFARGRIIDLSRGAAQLLDIVRTGTAKVRVSVVGTGPVIAATPPAGRPSGAFYVQLGSFSTRARAENLAARAAELMGVPLEISYADINGLLLYRVRIGPLQDRSTAAATRADAQGVGYTSAIVVVN